MFSRPVYLAILLTAAVGVPYLASDWGKTSHWISQHVSGTASTAGNSDWADSTGRPTGAQVFGGVTAGSGDTGTTPVVELSEALQFEVTPAWILGHWPRVTTGLPDQDLQGYRVPLVTGTNDDDLAGSLTYYFNKYQQCQRITFQGTTGDGRKLVELVTQRHGFVRQTSNDPGLYLYQTRWNGQAVSELHIRPSRVVRADNPLTRFEVLLALNNPQAK